MRALILAAGYGTRLQRDIDNTPGHTHLSGVPKPLLPIGGLPLISRWVLALQQHSRRISEIVVVTNAQNHTTFQGWARGFAGCQPTIRLVCEGSTSNETRSGALVALQLGAKAFGCDDDLIVIGGDTLFRSDFDLEEKLQEFDRHPGASLVLSYDVDDERTKKCGILEVDRSRKVTQFLEKPGPERTPSRLGCPCFYIFDKAALQHLNTFLSQSVGAKPLKEYDAPGNFIPYLLSRHPCYASHISGRYDVGGLATYIECNLDFSNTLAHVGLAVLLALCIRTAVTTPA